jgi:hypothetical protein
LISSISPLSWVTCDQQHPKATSAKCTQQTSRSDRQLYRAIAGVAEHQQASQQGCQARLWLLPDWLLVAVHRVVH